MKRLPIKYQSMKWGYQSIYYWRKWRQKIFENLPIKFNGGLLKPIAVFFKTTMPLVRQKVKHSSLTSRGQGTKTPIVPYAMLWNIFWWQLLIVVCSVLFFKGQVTRALPDESWLGQIKLNQMPLCDCLSF